MKLSVYVISFFLINCSLVNALDTVRELDLNKYEGTWNQLAFIPTRFQKKCVRNTTATYKILKPNLIEVTNKCQEEDGSVDSATGRARINDEFNISSKLEVTFVKLIFWIWPFGGDYWVTYIDDDYNLALIGHPELKYGWILSRSKTLNKEKYKEIAMRLKNQGYDPCKYMMSSTDAQIFDSETTLCQYLDKSNSQNTE